MNAKCPACGNEIGEYVDADQLQELMEEHITMCLLTRRLTRPKGRSK